MKRLSLFIISSFLVLTLAYAESPKDRKCRVHGSNLPKTYINLYKKASYKYEMVGGLKTKVYTWNSRIIPVVKHQIFRKNTYLHVAWTWWNESPFEAHFKTLRYGMGLSTVGRKIAPDFIVDGKLGYSKELFIGLATNKIYAPLKTKFYPFRLQLTVDNQWYELMCGGEWAADHF